MRAQLANRTNSTHTGNVWNICVAHILKYVPVVTLCQVQCFRRGHHGFGESSCDTTRLLSARACGYKTADWSLASRKVLVTFWIRPSKSGSVLGQPAGEKWGGVFLSHWSLKAANFR